MHGTGGLCALGAATFTNLSTLALDKGPGIANVSRAMRDGFSTGAGLSATAAGRSRFPARRIDAHPYQDGARRSSDRHSSGLESAHDVLGVESPTFD